MCMGGAAPSRRQWINMTLAASAGALFPWSPATAAGGMAHATQTTVVKASLRYGTGGLGRSDGLVDCRPGARRSRCLRT